ncbi:exonuclease SbcCD subunit D [Lederbergia wuyishanensis]|uniref:Nuclease SbcCD subunit D n=1 Tax=Lederbergia wuyishanensis TaxID=1347903 RepID=A0ABU0D014_9BACI|nr:exonuclease SbcCD subunit D [Lederbergia wuyishanensis]MCJ8006377.1 exonuclease SbcCD subunit D [Lederbergia wuyishanensis]MDQ0341746.1 exonuclease SbcD [Lederbergia wuyishanensis]
MKFIHTADWHLGKLVHGVYMTEDQRYVLNQFVQFIEEENPDAIIIAGDLYDRSVPPTESVSLLEEMLFKINVQLNVPILAISGNHDSAERLSFGSSWYKHSNLYINGKIEESFKPIHINGANFYLVPYTEPGIIREYFQDQSISSHDDAMKRIVSEIEECINPNEPNIFVGHAFVLGGKTSDSERTLSVGGSGCVSIDHFSPFSYTALGHLHSPDAIKHDSVRYSGSLLKYSFSEVNHKKSVSIIDMNQDGSYVLQEKTINPQKDMREISGYLEELLDVSFYQHQKVDDYLKVTLLNEGALIDPINKLRQIYPNVMHLERRIELYDLKNKHSFTNSGFEKKSELELFNDFYQEMTTSEFSEEKRRLMAQMIDDVKKGMVLV